MAEASLTPAGRDLLERGRRLMAAAPPRGPVAGVDDSERAVGAARAALTASTNAMNARDTEAS